MPHLKRSTISFSAESAAGELRRAAGQIERAIERAQYPGMGIHAGRKHRLDFKDIANDAGLDVTYDISEIPISAAARLWDNTLGRYRSGVFWRLRKVFLNRDTSIGVLTDEFLHIWNRGRKGDFLPESLKKLHRDLWARVALDGTRSLGQRDEDIYHALEMLNFLNSGYRWPRFMELIPAEDWNDWFSYILSIMKKAD